MTYRFFCVATLSLAFAIANAMAASAETDASLRADDARSEFSRAWSALRNNPAASPAPNGDSANLRAYPLYPYLEAARLSQRITRRAAAGNDDPTLDDEIDSFLTTHGAAPVVKALRNEWALHLISRKDWHRYLAAFGARDDTEQRCAQFEARIALNQTDGLSAAVIRQWKEADKPSPTCDAAFSWAQQSGLLTPDLVLARARRVLANGHAALARLIALQLPETVRADIAQWAALIDNPQREMDVLLSDPTKPVTNDALLDGWQRLARKDPDAALERVARLRATRGLSDPAAFSRYARALALGLAWSRKPQALQWFATVASADVDPIAAEWWARAALWVGDWPTVIRAISALPDTVRGEQRWRYWRARAAVATGDTGGRTALETLTAEDGWYPALAAAQLSRPYAPHPQPIQPDEDTIARIAAHAGFVRAREWFMLDEPALAAAEFWAALPDVAPTAKAQAAVLAMRWGWYDQGIAAASSQKVFTDYALLYPQPYNPQVQAAAALSGLPRPLIYGVLRQESLYRADAVSRANAYGLTQMLLETAERTARKWQQPKPTRASLFDPSTNVPLGAAHLRDLVDRFASQLPVAIAAYNAGPNAAARWLPPQSLPADIWIENIPFNETRHYVQRVLWHSLVFAWMADKAKPQAVDFWLTPIVRSDAGRVTARQATTIPASDSPAGTP